MALTKADIDTLRMHPSKDYSELSDTVMTILATKAPAKPTPKEGAKVPMDRICPKLLKLVKHFYPEESQDFEDEEMLAYADHYTDVGYAEQVRMVGEHMKDRLAKRVEGRPWRDDSRGLAAQAEEDAAEADAAAKAAEEAEAG